MQSKVVVLTLIGPDKPGVVEALSECVAQHRGNWEESRMAHLGGQFAGLLRVTVPSNSLQALEQDLRGLGAQGLAVHSHAEATPTKADAGRRVRLELAAHDREGIVRDISTVIASRNLNVEELSTRCESAAMTGETLFRAEALLRLPEDQTTTTDTIRALRDELEAIGNDLMVDLVPVEDS